MRETIVRAAMVFCAGRSLKKIRSIVIRIRKETDMNTDKLLEFDQIRTKWKSFALTTAAADRIDHMTYYLNESELRKQLQDTTDARNLIECCGIPPLTEAEHVKQILARAVKEGCLTPEQLEETKNLLTAVRRLKDYLIKGRQHENALAWYEQNLDALEPLREKITVTIRGGEVDDYASKRLQQIRAEMTRIREKIKQKAEQAIRANKPYLADAYCTIRSGHVCIPVKKEYKGKIKGSVIDQSSTGNTLFMEPAAVCSLQETVQVLELEEEQEVSRILYTLTAMAADYEPEITEDIRIMEKLDFIFSKGKLSIDMDAVAANINTDSQIRLKNARHPLMEKEKNVPLQFEIGKEADGIVITGPNTGGKTVAMKTVALNCYLAQCGLHVTCEEADICMNSSFLCDIGDGQNLTENLSTFSAHIKNVLEITETVGPDSLVMMDELGSGTDPTEGMGIAVAVLKELVSSGCLFVVTTHYPQVKEYAEHTDRIVNARMEFDKHSLQPTYRMIIGEAGESCAFFIAQNLGMPQRMLETAMRAAYGPDAARRSFHWKQRETGSDTKRAKTRTRIKRAKKSAHSAQLSEKFQIGDSVMVLPDKKTGIVCRPVNERGMLQVQLPDQKIWISHKRAKLQVAAAQMYPEGYDFSIVFDTVKNRKIRHEMSRKYTEQVIETEDSGMDEGR